MQKNKNKGYRKLRVRKKERGEWNDDLIVKENTEV
jgi:hypothetical protein